VGTAFSSTLLKEREGRIEVMGRRGRRIKRLLDNLKEKRRCWKLKEEALYGELALEEAADLS
jgi:hypothetical protein